MDQSPFILNSRSRRYQILFWLSLPRVAIIAYIFRKDKKTKKNEKKKGKKRREETQHKARHCTTDDEFSEACEMSIVNSGSSSISLQGFKVPAPRRLDISFGEP